MSFVFWGLFAILGLTLAGYYGWMVWVERIEEDESDSVGRSESS